MRRVVLDRPGRFDPRQEKRTDHRGDRQSSVDLRRKPRLGQTLGGPFSPLSMPIFATEYFVLTFEIQTSTNLSKVHSESETDGARERQLERNCGFPHVLKRL